MRRKIKCKFRELIEISKRVELELEKFENELAGEVDFIQPYPCIDGERLIPFQIEKKNWLMNLLNEITFAKETLNKTISRLEEADEKWNKN